MWSGCGYTLHGTKSALLEERGIRTLYIDKVRNDSYKVAVDTALYDALVKTFQSGNRVRLVASEENADAILLSQIVLSDTAPAGERGDIDGMVTATQYSAGLNCQFQLRRHRSHPDTIWVGTIGRSKLYQAGTRSGIAGTTSSLINESEFERAVDDISTQIAVDLHDAMLENF